MRRSLMACSAGVAAILANWSCGPAPAAEAAPVPAYAPARPICQVTDDRLAEASGLAVDPDRMFMVNDGGTSVQVYVLDTDCQVDEVIEAPVDPYDVEDLARASDGTLWLADIGDNEGSRDTVALHTLGADGTAALFRMTYPDGAHDAETLLMAPDGTLLVVTKGDSGPVAVYRFPKELRSGATHPLERVGNARDAGQPAATARITDGAVSADGVWVVLRTQRHVVFHRMADLFSGNWREAGRLDVKRLGELQGEGIALGADGTLYLAGEGGGKSRPGTFARLTCSPR